MSCSADHCDPSFRHLADKVKLATIRFRIDRESVCGGHVIALCR